MQKASVVGAIILGLFGLPFLAFGLFFVAQMWNAAANGNSPIGFLPVGFGLLFACIGLGLISAAVGAYRFMKRRAAAVAANPSSPWLWRDDWSVGRSNGKGRGANIALWVFAVLWDCISFPAAVLTFPKLMAGDLRLLLVLIFPVIGIILTAAAVLGTMRAQRFGKTSFWFANNPFVPGSKLTGYIHMRMPTRAEHGIDVRLSCVRRVTTGSGKSRSTTDTVLWQDEKNVRGELVTHGDFEAQVPVEFDIPVDAPASNDANADDKIVWILHAQADVPGVDYKEDYEVPVFQTGESRAMAASVEGWVDRGAHDRDSTSTQPWAAVPAIATKVSDEPVVAPHSTHIRITEDGASTVVYFPPLRNPGQTFGLFAFTLVWTGVVYMLFTHPAPWIFRIIFGGSDVLLGMALFNMIFGSKTLRVAEGTLNIRTAILGIAWYKTVPVEGVQSIAPVSQGQADASGAARFGIVFQLKDGRALRVATSSLSRAEARWIVAALDRAMGFAGKIEAEFKPLTLNFPVQNPGVIKVGNVPVQKIGRLIGIVVFVIWLLFFGSIFLKFFVR